MISVGKMFVALLSMKTSVAVPIRKSSAWGKIAYFQKNSFREIQESKNVYLNIPLNQSMRIALL